METFSYIKDFANGLGVVVILLGAGYLIVFGGRLITRSHHDEVLKIKDASEKRAWEEVKEARDELKANNEVLKRLADTLETFMRKP